MAITKKYTERVQVNVTELQKDEIAKHADNADISQSEWVRKRYEEGMKAYLEQLERSEDQENCKSEY